MHHLRLGRNISKTNFAYANQNHDYRIFKEFAYNLISEARDKPKTNIFNIGISVYAFDSTTINLCLSVFRWAKFKKKKGGIKVHTPYDVETQKSTFIHITNTSVHNRKAMSKIPL